MTNSSARPPGSKHPGTATLTAVLLAFFAAGAAMVLVIWVTLSDFLAGHPVEGGRFLVAIALAGLFGALAWLLALYLQTTFLPASRPANRGDDSLTTEVQP